VCHTAAIPYQLRNKLCGTQQLFLSQQALSGLTCLSRAAQLSGGGSQYYASESFVWPRTWIALILGGPYTISLNDSLTKDCHSD